MKNNQASKHLDDSSEEIERKINRLQKQNKAESIALKKILKALSEFDEKNDKLNSE
jgi:chaperonin cofactor prefoldin